MDSVQNPATWLLRRLVNLPTYRERDLFVRKHREELMGLRICAHSAEVRIVADAIATLRLHEHDVMFKAAHVLQGSGHPEGQKILEALREIEEAVDRVAERLADQAEEASDDA